jgi:hypothetical protein
MGVLVLSPSVATAAVAVLLLATTSAFTLNVQVPGQISTSTSTTQLFAQKQTRSSLLKPPKSKTANKDNGSNKKEEEDGKSEEIYGAKFFGGSAIKEELFDAEAEERADKMLKLYPPKKKFDSQSTSAVAEAEKVGTETETDVTTVVDDPDVYPRFMDKDAFPDDAARNLAQRLQSSINQALYDSDDVEINMGDVYSPTLQWNTPLSRDSKSKTPLDELTNALDFYKRIDVAIIAAKGLSSVSESKVQKMEVKWQISLVWPNVFESRVLVTGTSIMTVDSASSMILSQTDTLDNGGKEGKDIIKAISSQLNPRFWDLYHVGMTPSAELMPIITDTAKTKSKGLFSPYKLFEMPERLVLQPSIVTSGGRDTREAQALPNHAFTSIIKTTGPTGQRYVTTSPVEVSIRREEGGEGEKAKSIISWNIALPPEYISFYDELSQAVSDEDKAEGNEPTNGYAYLPRRLVATLPYGGNAQDVEVTEIRKKLYESIIKDGLKPKLSDSGRPQFFFLQNDAKACFTADGGLGMAVYEWRPKSANSNEVGIELEL